jgi:hypothetical protein
MRPGAAALDRRFVVCRVHVSSFVIDEPLVSGFDQPQAERHRPTDQIVRQLPPRQVMGFLDDIGRVEPRLDLGSQSPLD